MAAQFREAVTTNDGRSLIAESAATQTAIEFTGMGTGDGVYTWEEAVRSALEQATGLKSQKQMFPIAGISRQGDYVALIRGVISNEGLDAAYNWNEVGVFARLEGSGEEPILFSIAVVPEDGGTEIPAYTHSTAMTVSQSFYLKVNNAASVTINVTSDLYELVQDAGLNADLATTDKRTLVAAINEVKRIADQGGNASLATVEEVTEMANKLMEDSGGGDFPETATDEEVEEMIDNLDDL